MKDVAAHSRDDVEDGALHVAVLGRCAQLQHFHRLDRVGIRPRRRTDVGAVDLIGVLVGAVTQRLRRRALADVGGRAHAGRGVDQIEIGETPHGRVHHPFVVVGRAHLRRRQVDDGRFAGHRHRLLDGADLHRRVELDGRADVDRNRFASQCRKSGKRVLEAIGAWRQDGKPVRPGLGGDRGWRSGDARATQRDGDARQNVSALVDDFTEDLARCPLRGRRRGHRDDQQQDCTQPVHTTLPAFEETKDRDGRRLIEGDDAKIEIARDSTPLSATCQDSRT